MGRCLRKLKLFTTPGASRADPGLVRRSIQPDTTTCCQWLNDPVELTAISRWLPGTTLRQSRSGAAFGFLFVIVVLLACSGFIRFSGVLHGVLDHTCAMSLNAARSACLYRLSVSQACSPLLFVPVYVAATRSLMGVHKNGHQLPHLHPCTMHPCQLFLLFPLQTVYTIRHIFQNGWKSTRHGPMPRSKREGVTGSFPGVSGLLA